MAETTQAYLFAFFASLVLTLLFIPAVIRLAKYLKILDQPGERKIHKNPTPCAGGFAIFIVFNLIVIGSILSLLALRKSASGHLVPGLVAQLPYIRAVSAHLFFLLGGAAVITAVGFIDDLIGVKFDFRIKLLVEIVVALILAIHGIRLDFPGSAPWDIAITVLWIVGITNAFNLLDNMDGLSAGVGAICSTLLFFVALRHGQFFVGLVYLTFTGCLLGFLRYNFRPAKIFLGDSGALFIGFILACMTVIQSYVTPQSHGIFPILTPVMILSLPIFDTTRVVLIRLFEGRPIYQGDRRHISHRLCEMGMKQSLAVCTIYMMTFTLGIGCTVLDLNTHFVNGIILLQLVSAVLTFTFFMSFPKKEKARGG